VTYHLDHLNRLFYILYTLLPLHHYFDKQDSGEYFIFQAILNYQLLLEQMQLNLLVLSLQINLIFEGILCLIYL
jgi:hypothetical protein